MQMSCDNISMIDTAIVIANNGSVSRFVPRTTNIRESIIFFQKQIRIIYSKVYD